MADANIVTILMAIAALAAFWLAATVQELLREKNRLLKEDARLRSALTGIAMSSCCESCQEARLVALKALEGE